MANNKKFVGPLFIIGMPRSGTKLLRDLINRHPLVRIPEIETEFLIWLVKNISVFGDLSTEEGFHRLYQAITKFPYFLYRRDEGLLLDERRWFAACDSYDAKGIFEALIRQETGATAANRIIWGDKSPSYINDIQLISLLWPESRFIHIVRDVRDYCLSINAAWRKDMLRAAQRWTDSVGMARQHGRSLGNRYLEIQYEALLENPEDVLRRVCKHVDIEFDPAMLTLDKPSENIGDAKGKIGIQKDNKKKFLKRLSPSLLKRIEAISGSVLMSLGYELIYPLQPTLRIGSVEMLARQIKDGVNLIRSEIDQRGLIGAIIFHGQYYKATRV